MGLLPLKNVGSGTLGAKKSGKWDFGKNVGRPKFATNIIVHVKILGYFVILLKQISNAACYPVKDSHWHL